MGSGGGGGGRTGNVGRGGGWGDTWYSPGGGMTHAHYGEVCASPSVLGTPAGSSECWMGGRERNGSGRSIPGTSAINMDHSSSNPGVPLFLFVPSDGVDPRTDPRFICRFTRKTARGHRGAHTVGLYARRGRDKGRPPRRPPPRTGEQLPRSFHCFLCFRSPSLSPSLLLYRFGPGCMANVAPATAASGIAGPPLDPLSHRGGLPPPPIHREGSSSFGSP